MPLWAYPPCLNTNSVVSHLSGKMSSHEATGYGPSSRYSRLFFSGDDGDYELWETRFMGYLELKDLKDVVNSTENTVDAAKNSKAFSELIQ